jgi:hypothetical protein
VGVGQDDRLHRGIRTANIMILDSRIRYTVILAMASTKKIPILLPAGSSKPVLVTWV